MPLKPHWLRPEETTKIVEVMDQTLTQQIKNVLESAKRNITEQYGVQLSDEEISDFVNLARGRIPSNATGNGLDLHVMQSLKLVIEMMRKKAQLEKKIGKDFLPQFQELALDAIKNNKSKNLNLTMQLILKITNKQLNDPEFERKYGKDFLKRFNELSLKLVNDPNSLDNQEQLELIDMIKIVLNMVKVDLEEKLRMNPANNQVRKDLDGIKEMARQVEVWEGGVLIDIEEGVFAMGDKTKRSLSSILASAEVDPIEEALVEKGIIHTLANAIEGVVHPSVADKLTAGPNFNH